MSELRSSAGVLVVPAVVLVMALATPAFADATTQSKKAAAAARLDTLKASDAELEEAVKALDAGVQTQAATTDAAQQALRAAETTLGTAQARLAATEARMGELRNRTAEAAVRAYVHPGGDTLLQIVGSRDMGEASRRQALLASVVSSDRDVVDQLRATRQDEQFDKENLASARDLAAERKKAAADKLAALQKTRNDQARLQTALDARIAEVTSEVAALSREEDTLAAQIRSRQGADGAPASSGRGTSSGAGVAWPAAGTVTSGFGYRWGVLHAGIDIANSVGTPIKAAKAGTVIVAGWNAGGYGNWVIIDHGGGFSTLYGHMSKVRTSEGQTVKQGQLIGDMGSTGNSTGPHVHFETRVNGTPQDPTRYLS